MTDYVPLGELEARYRALPPQRVPIGAEARGKLRVFKQPPESPMRRSKRRWLRTSIRRPRRITASSAARGSNVPWRSCVVSCIRPFSSILRPMIRFASGRGWNRLALYWIRQTPDVPKIAC